MRVLSRVVLLFLGALALHAQTGTLFDCTFSESFTDVGTGSTFNNTFGPCVSWRVSYTAAGTAALALQFETSPDSIAWTAISTSCAAAQPPCVIDGSNPMRTVGSATFAVRAFGKYVRLNVTNVTRNATVAVTVYGYKGLTGPRPIHRRRHADAICRHRKPGRVRPSGSSSPTGIFDSQTEYDTNPLTWDTVLTGGGTATFIPNSGSVRLRVASNGDKVVRQPPLFVLPAGKKPVDRDDRRNGCAKTGHPGSATSMTRTECSSSRTVPPAGRSAVVHLGVCCRYGSKSGQLESGPTGRHRPERHHTGHFQVPDFLD